MSHTYTPSATAAWNTTFTLPDDADDRGAAAINTPVEALADNVAKLKQAIGLGWNIIPLGAGQPVSWVWYVNVASEEMGWEQTVIASTAEIWLPFATPEDGRITEYSVVLDGDAGSGAGDHDPNLPANMPVVQLYRHDALAASSSRLVQVATVTDPSVDWSTYQARHAVTKTGLTEDLSSTRSYYLRVIGEYGTNSIANELLLTQASFKLEAS